MLLSIRERVENLKILLLSFAGFLVILCPVFGLISVAHAEDVIRIPFGLSLNVEIVGNRCIYPANQTYEEVPGALILAIDPVCSHYDSRPAKLRFDFEKFCQNESFCPQDIPLYELRYEIYNNDENVPYFTNRIDLYGKKGPGTLEVSPEPNIPPGSNRIRVDAELFYSGIVANPATSSAEVNVYPFPSGQYNRIRDGYIRRHLSGNGRSIPYVWLKEYEPGRDARELLPHSRTFTDLGSEGNRTRTYIPWTHECINNECGSSIIEGANALYYGTENPLLEAGLAMATFALEYLSEGSGESLDAALKLLEYVEKSEWVNRYGVRTGFFLRSDAPGHLHKQTGREYFFASIDEIIGMTLGLLYLDRALEYANDAANQDRLEYLVDRLGKHLKENYYFLVPPKDDPDLKQERHKGWSGGYAYQWFLKGAFKAITQGRFESYTPEVLGVTDTDWQRMYNMPWKGKEGEDDKFRTGFAIGTGLSAKDRAILSIQTLGVGMLFGEDPIVLKFEIPLSGVTMSIPLGVGSFDHFNYSMLLHVFQLGMADTTRDPDTVGKIKQSMARLIKGVLGSQVYEWVNLPKFIASLVTWGVDIGRVEDALHDVVGLIKIPLPVGTANPDRDFYSAAIADIYDLDEIYEPVHHISGSANEEYWELITGVTNGVTGISADYATANPVKTPICDICSGGTHNGDVCDDSDPDTGQVSTADCVASGGICKSIETLRIAHNLPLNHNPDELLGSSFIWERDAGHWQGRKIEFRSYNDWNGLGFEEIISLHERGRDLMVEGAGLGYLLPTMLRNCDPDFIAGDILDIQYFCNNPDFIINLIDGVSKTCGNACFVATDCMPTDQIFCNPNCQYDRTHESCNLTYENYKPILQACSTVPATLAKVEHIGKECFDGTNDGQNCTDDSDCSSDVCLASQNDLCTIGYGERTHPDEFDDKRCVYGSSVIEDACNLDSDCGEKQGIIGRCEIVRNDSYFNPATLDWGYHELNMDRPGVALAQYTHDEEVQSDTIYVGADYDFYNFFNHPDDIGKEIKMTFDPNGSNLFIDDILIEAPPGAMCFYPNFEFGEIKVHMVCCPEVIGEIPPNCGLEDPRRDRMEITFPAKAKHIFMVSGGGSYSIDIPKPVWFNYAPVAQDQNINIYSNSPTDIILPATDQENDPLTYTILTYPRSGTLTGTEPNLTYTPNENYLGEDSLSFKVTDGDKESEIATLFITVSMPPTAITIDNISVEEGNSGTANAVFTVTLSSNTGGIDSDVSVNYASFDGNAVAGEDYQAVSGTVVFNQGPLPQTRTITVPVFGDSIAEPLELFFIRLSDVTGSWIVDREGICWISRDDGAPPEISITNSMALEGDSGSQYCTFPVSLSEAAAQQVTLDFEAIPGSASENDFSSRSGTLVFEPGETSKEIEISVVGDTFIEGDEFFTLTLRNLKNAEFLSFAEEVQVTGTIIDNETSVSAIPTDAGWEQEGGQAGAFSGWSVASAGDVNGDGYDDVIVGNPLKSAEGEAVIYLGGSDGVSNTPWWTATGTAAGERFGWSVASAGDVNGDGYDDVIVGAPYYQDSGNWNAGAAFLFYGSSGSMAVTPAWSAWGGGTVDGVDSRFGYAVESADFNLDGYADIWVSAPYYDGKGAVFLWYGSDTGPIAGIPSANYGFNGTPNNADAVWLGDQQGALFGFSISVEDKEDSLGFLGAIGAPSYPGGGAVFIVGGGAYQVINAPDTGGSNISSFGFSVAITNDTDGDQNREILVGAPTYSNWYQYPESRSWGRAFLYNYWEAEPIWSAFVEGVNHFGYSVSSAGDMNGDGFDDVVVGDRRYDNLVYGAGRSFVYFGSKIGLADVPGWIFEDTDGFPGFPQIGNTMMSNAGDVNNDGFDDLIIGCPGFSNNQTSEGRVLVFYGAPSEWIASPGWGDTGTQTNSNFGHSVATAGDVNSDGFSDVIVGEPSYDNGQEEEGIVHLYLGTADGLARDPAWSVEGQLDYAQLGSSVASAGDVNGDNFDDIIIGAPGYGTGGRAFVYLGSEVGPSSQPDWIFDGENNGDRLGNSVATAGDVNGDGYDDVIIGAPEDSLSGLIQGKVYVFLGSSVGLPASPSWTFIGEQVIRTMFGAAYGFGWSVGTAGDINGDNFDDIIIGFPSYNINGGEPWTSPGAGRVYVFNGSSAGPENEPAWIANYDTAIARYGYSVGSAGDVNNDGFSDIIVGAPIANTAYVWFGSNTGLNPDSTPSNADWSAEQTGNYGWSVGTAGDVNGDGFGDIVVGEPIYQNNQGRISVYLGSNNGLSGLPIWVAEGSWESSGLGKSVSTAGDINNDGYSDIVAGADNYSPYQSPGMGAIFVFYGGMAAGSSFVPYSPYNIEQFRSDGTTVITEGGSIEENTVIFKGTVSDPRGENVQLEIELQAIGEAFTGTPTHTIPPVPSGSEAVITSDPLINEDYRWQYRTKNALGKTSLWTEFKRPGYTDFTVSDNQVPTVSILFPTSGDFYETSLLSVNLMGTASDDNGVTSVTWTNARGGSGTGILPYSEPGYDWRIGPITLHGGNNLITVYAWDLQNNANVDSLYVNLEPSADRYVLAVEREGTGNGKVTSDVGGVDCGDADQDGISKCNSAILSINKDTIVNLTAVPDMGSVFGSWGGDSDCVDGVVTMDAHKDCIAYFYRDQSFTISIEKDGTGLGIVTSEPAGIHCGADCLEDYYDGMTINLYAVAEAGSVFAGWGGDGDCGDGTVSMDTEKFCTATFNLSPVMEAWTRRYSHFVAYYDRPYDIAVDANGNVYVTGYVSGYVSGTEQSIDYATIKYGPDGNQLWMENYNGTGNGYDFATALEVDQSGNIYVTGYSPGLGTDNDFVTIKYDTDGNQLWAARYNSLGDGDDKSYDIASDTSGNVYVTGESESDFATIKYDSNGNQMWSASYDGPGNALDRASKITVDDQGNVYVTGYSTGSGTDIDYTTIKYDSNGNQLWTARYNGPGNGYDGSQAIKVDSSGNVYVTGRSNIAVDDNDYTTIKYDTNGNQIWIALYDGPANSMDFAEDIAVDNMGHVYVTGASTGSGTGIDYATIKYDPDGNQIWVNRYSWPANESDHAKAIMVDSSGNVYVTGLSTGSGTSSDYATIMYDPDGNQKWVARYNGPSNGDDDAAAIALDNVGNVYVTGGSDGSYLDWATIKYTLLMDNDDDRYLNDIDCNDNDSAINPAAVEVCDGIDNNCNKSIDEGLSFDADTDGHYSSESCFSPSDDCDDNNSDIWNCNTPVSSEPITLWDSQSKASITFTSVTAGGHTIMSEMPCIVDVPTGYSLVPPGGPECFQTETSAEFSGLAEVCIAYDDSLLSTEEETSLQMMSCDTGGNCKFLFTSLHLIDENKICALIDHFPNLFLFFQMDSDDDGFVYKSDNCPNVSNADQADDDFDGVGDVCDNCPLFANTDQVDTDQDGIGDQCDRCSDTNVGMAVDTYGCAMYQKDSDSDGVTDDQDIFPNDPYEWADNDRDGIGDNADTDDDNDGMPDTWELDWGLDPLLDDASQDADGDGYTNLQEYRRRTDPKDPSSYPINAMPWLPLLLLDD